MNVLRALLILVVLVLVGTAIFIWSGVYNIAADDHHTPVVAKVLEVLRERSVARHAQGIAVPDLDSPAMIAEGAEHYAAMCTGCHLAPGVDRSEIRPGLYPRPPNLREHGVDDPAQAFWVIKHGIKMSGMPAWGTTHDDAAIWNIVAFVRRLPNMPVDEYQRLVGSMMSGDGHAHDHDSATPPVHDEGEAGHHDAEGDAGHDHAGEADHRHDEDAKPDHDGPDAVRANRSSAEPEPSAATGG